MKLTILQENLNKAISLASRFTTTRSQLPILGNILLTSSKTKLSVSSTNLEISILTSIGAKVEKDGEIVIPSKVLLELVSNLPKDSIILSSEKEQIKISTTSFSSTILGMDSTDFPKIPSKINKDKSLLLPKDGFVNGLARVIFSSSLDETRPVLTGVLFVLSKGELSLVATDGFRLSLVKIQIPNLKIESKIILPKTILSEVGRLSEVDDLFLEFNESEKQVVFNQGDTFLSSRLIEGEFPDFSKIIPRESKISILVDKEDLLRAVKLAAPFSRDNSNIVKLKITKDLINVVAESSQGGNQETKVEAKVDKTGAQEFEISFNYKFLEDFIGSVSGEEVKMEFSEVDKPGVFTDPTSPEYLHLIMPVKV